MAKPSKTKKSKGRNRPRQRRGFQPPSDALVHANRYAQLLKDPCNGPVGNGAYPGQQGMIQRFVADFSAGTGAAQTCGYYAYWPALNGYSSLSLATSATTFTPAWTVAAAASPGHNFLSPVASKIRGHAACITSVPSALSITNMVGEYAYGVISSSEFGSFMANTTVDGFFQLLPTRSIIQRATLDVKWVPGTFDNKFSDYGVQATVDSSDTNVIIVAYRGLPASTPIGVRFTSVLEWCPKAGQGMAADANNVAAGINHTAVAVALHQKQPGWWHGIAENMKEDVSKTVRFVSRNVMSQAARKTMDLVGTWAGGAAGSALVALV